MLEPDDVRSALKRGFARKGSPERVVVVGAGIAGLAAAYELSRVGHEVVVLEAQNRAGGRILTLREPFADGLYAEAGAMNVTASCFFTLHYLELLEIELGVSEMADVSFSFFLDGRFVRPDAAGRADFPLDLTEEERELGVWGMRERYVQALYDGLGEPIRAESFGMTDAMRPFDELSTAEALRRQGASPAAIQLLKPLFNEMVGNDMERHSALSWLRFEALHGLGTTPHWYTIAGGSDTFPRRFAERVAGLVRYGCPVVAIAQDDDAVRATFLQAASPQTIEADRLVCTIPFPALDGVDLSEARLSSGKRAAIERLEYHSVVRTFLQARTKFWEGESVSVSTDLPINWARDATWSQPGPRKILESYATGSQARALAALDEAERLSFALAEMEKVFPGIRESFEGGASWSWDDDPWTRGGYVAPAPGHSALMPDIARAEGRIHFAGEHTASNPFGGSMSGALEGAVRAVLEVLEAPVAAPV